MQGEQTPASDGLEADVEDGAVVTHLLSQRFGPQSQIAALQRDGRVTIWREDGAP